MPAAHRVLVVDDEPNIVDVVTMALRYQGFEDVELDDDLREVIQVTTAWLADAVARGQIRWVLTDSANRMGDRLERGHGRGPAGRHAGQRRRRAV
jgi:CheY-like chemotaxis protein